MRPWPVLDGDSVRPSDTSAANTMVSESGMREGRLRTEAKEPRGFPMQWADPGVEAVDESVPLMGSRELTHR